MNKILAAAELAVMDAELTGKIADMDRDIKGKVSRHNSVVEGKGSHGWFYRWYWGEDESPVDRGARIRREIERKIIERNRYAKALMVCRNDDNPKSNPEAMTAFATVDVIDGLPTCEIIHYRTEFTILRED
jgi:hypothetical protein